MSSCCSTSRWHLDEQQTRLFPLRVRNDAFSTFSEGAKRCALSWHPGRVLGRGGYITSPKPPTYTYSPVRWDGMRKVQHRDRQRWKDGYLHAPPIWILTYLFRYVLGRSSTAVRYYYTHPPPPYGHAGHGIPRTPLGQRARAPARPLGLQGVEKEVPRCLTTPARPWKRGLLRRGLARGRSPAEHTHNAGAGSPADSCY